MIAVVSLAVLSKLMSQKQRGCNFYEPTVNATHLMQRVITGSRWEEKQLHPGSLLTPSLLNTGYESKQQIRWMDGWTGRWMEG